MLKDIIPTELRSKLYAVYAVLALAIGAVQVGFASADAGQPVWLTSTLAVFVFLGAGLGFTAQANPTVAPKPVESVTESIVTLSARAEPIPIDPDTPLYYEALNANRP